MKTEQCRNAAASRLAKEQTLLQLKAVMLRTCSVPRGGSGLRHDPRRAARDTDRVPTMADDAVHSAAQAVKDAAAGDASARERHKQGQRTAQLSKVHRKLEERRAQREGAATPASPETEASSAAAAEIFAAAVETAEKVWVKVAPEDEPFKWKYVARAELLKAQQAIRDLLPGDGDADVRTAPKSRRNEAPSRT